MENINKYNFWDEIKKDYPLAYEDFQEWMEIYREDNEWDELFNNDLVSSDNKITLNDLPTDMQIGLMLRYFNDNENLSHPIGNVSAYGDLQYVLSAFQMYFICIDGQLSEEKKKQIIELN